jgi:hypothetical protein
MIFAAGIVMAMPGGGELGLSHVHLAFVALGLAAIGAALAWMHRKAVRE